MSEPKTYPRIWDQTGERKIIGETKVSWLVVEREHENAEWVPHVMDLYHYRDDSVGRTDWNWIKSREWVDLVNKKNPNKDKGYGNDTWYFTEESFLAYRERMWLIVHTEDLVNAVRHACWSTLTRAQFDTIAEMVGYEEKL